MAILVTQTELELNQVKVSEIIKNNYSRVVSEEYEKAYRLIMDQVPYQDFVKFKRYVETDQAQSLLFEAQVHQKVAVRLLKEREFLIPGVNCMKDYPPQYTILGRN